MHNSRSESPSDPSPNTYDPNTFDPLDGGIGYAWTVTMSGTDFATFQDVAGAWSWDEDGLLATALGWTHTSRWVALTLTEATEFTFRLESRANVPNPFDPTPGAVAGSNFFPGMTLYRGWDGDGPDFHTYNNQGNVAWAEDITYITHMANPGATHVIEATWLLASGQYTLALGGNSSSAVAEPLQGFAATFTTAPVPEPGSAALALAGALAMLSRRQRTGPRGGA
jgi:hypothetical protein